MQIIYGTGNMAKVKHMQSMLQNTGIDIIGIKEVLSEVPHVDESGNDPLENAYIKACTYYEILRRPVFSCDSGLYIEGLEDRRQPGVHVRNINGKTLTDEEMIEHYSGLARQLGGSCIAQYRNAICLITGSGRIIKYMGEDIFGERFIITTAPHKNRNEGYPLDSLSIDMDSGKYYYDLEQKEALAWPPAGRFNNALFEDGF